MALDPASGPPGRLSRARDAARVLPLAGFFLLLPPVIAPFAAPADVLGVPLVVVYLGAVWLGLVAVAALLARVLAPPPARPEAPPPRD
ncbi:MAG: hypothetical protein U1F45_13195 [Burkholderiales bacterium]